MKPETITAWHFLPANGRLTKGDNRKPVLNRWLHSEGTPKLCHHGLHASVAILDALKYAPGPVLCRVLLKGDIQHGGDKYVARSRKVIAKADVSLALHKFAIACARRALRRGSNPDPRSLAALRVKARWLAGKATDEELADAHAAAYDAVCGSTKDAVCDAAEKAAYCASYSTAHHAAYYASYYATHYVARDAEQAWQTKNLTRLIKKYHNL